MTNVVKNQHPFQCNISDYATAHIVFQMNNTVFYAATYVFRRKNKQNNFVFAF